MDTKDTERQDVAKLAQFKGTAQYWCEARQFVINQADEMPNATTCF